MLHGSKDMDEEILYAPSPSSWFAVWFVVTLVKLVKLDWLLVNSVTLLPPTGNNCSEKQVSNSANLKKREEAILRSFKY